MKPPFNCILYFFSQYSLHRAARYNYASYGLANPAKDLSKMDTKAKLRRYPNEVSVLSSGI